MDGDHDARNCLSMDASTCSGNSQRCWPTDMGRSLAEFDSPHSPDRILAVARISLLGRQSRPGKNSRAMDRHFHNRGERNSHYNA
jgi:hypothetical protein